MFPNITLGGDTFKTWPPAQRRDEIRKLVEGFRSGLPLGILLRMTEEIAGSRKKARKHLLELLTADERQAAVDKEVGGMKVLATEMLL